MDLTLENFRQMSRVSQAYHLQAHLDATVGWNPIQNKFVILLSSSSPNTIEDVKQKLAKLNIDQKAFTIRTID